MYTREEFENLINDSPLFGINKLNSPELFDTEKYNFLTLLTDYYRIYIYPNKSLDSYSMTLMEAAAECIKYYDREKGEFLSLFNSVMKRKWHIAQAKEMIDSQRKGIKISDSDGRLISKIMAFVQSKGLDIYDLQVQEKIANIMDMDLEKVKQLIKVNDDAVTVFSTIKNDDGDEVELYEYQSDGEKILEDQFIEEESLNEFVGEIDRVYSTIQSRQMKMIAMLLTTEIIKSLDCDIEKAKKVLSQRRLFNEEIFEYYKQNKMLPTAKQIGERCRVSEQSLSRAYKNFKKKLKSVKSIKK